MSFAKRILCLATAILSLAGVLQTTSAETLGAPRHIEIDAKQASKPLDRFFDFCVGSDFPGTLIRDDSQAQLKTTVNETGFRYIRFHAIFHDVLGTVRIENDKTVYDWSKIDQLYDDLLQRNIRPFVELGFTPNAMKTSDNRIFYWQGNTSHPVPAAWPVTLSQHAWHITTSAGTHLRKSVNPQIALHRGSQLKEARHRRLGQNNCRTF